MKYSRISISMDPSNIKKQRLFWCWPKHIGFILCLLVVAKPNFAQHADTSNLPAALSLHGCIDFALSHQPSIKQTAVDIEIAKTTNAINLAGLLPQANLNGTLTHYLSLPTNFVNSGGTITKQKTGIENTFVPAITVTQSLFSPSLLYAKEAAPLYVKQAEQVSDSTKINIIVAVSKSFYSLLLTLQQINVLKEDTARLGKAYHDSYHQYVAGIVDETDYEQAQITLNNSIALLRQSTESIHPLYATLKQTMGYQPEKQFDVLYDTLQMMKEVDFDTTQVLQYDKRVEFQVLQTQKALQKQSTNYYKKAWLPTASAFFNYYLPFQNNSFTSLFGQSYPYSNIGLQFTLPIFTGFSRLNSEKRSQLQENLIDLGEIGLRSQIYTEYANALANYKSNAFSLALYRNNQALAKRVYKVVYLQFTEGVVPYLNVITAESNLITSEIGYINALFQLLSSKIDLEKAMGLIKP
jgi:outer membrane protein TolC